MPNPRVSVVIAFLNGERYLGEAIESVMAQTYRDWELLLVDDGSTDGSSPIAKEYATRWTGKIRYLEHSVHQNLGTSASRNLGLREASGEYLAYLDGDDVWLPNKLEEQVALLDENPEVAMVYGPAYEWAGWTGRPRDRMRDAFRDNAVPHGTVLRPPQMLQLFLVNQRAVPSPSGILVRTAAIRGVGGSEESFRGMYEDQVLYAKLGIATSVLVSGRCWYKYRVHDDQMVRRSIRAMEGMAIRERYLRWLEGYLVRRGLRGSPAWVSAQQALRPFNDPILKELERMRYFAGHFKRRIKERLANLRPVGVSRANLQAPPNDDESEGDRSQQ